MVGAAKGYGVMPRTIGRLMLGVAWAGLLLGVCVRGSMPGYCLASGLLVMALARLGDDILGRPGPLGNLLSSLWGLAFLTVLGVWVALTIALLGSLRPGN